MLQDLMIFRGRKVRRCSEIYVIPLTYVVAFWDYDPAGSRTVVVGLHCTGLL